jgi:hypothetical protein
MKRRKDEGKAEVKKENGSQKGKLNAKGGIKYRRKASGEA